MITSDDIEGAVEYLRRSGLEAAQARANRIYMEQWVKVVLAQQMRRIDGTAALQEREARCSDEYGEALEALRIAIELDEKHRFWREAASAKIEAFRTLEATRRAEGKAYS